MKIEIIGSVKRVAEMKEGIIYQNNFYAIREILFSYYTNDYTDENNIYSDSETTVAKFTVKSKLPY